MSSLLTAHCLLLEVNPAAITHFLRSRVLDEAGLPSDVSARTYGNKRYFGMVIADQSLKLGSVCNDASMFMQCVNDSLRVWTGIKPSIQCFLRKNISSL